jgi:CCR4-NOT transcription complex subunit 7/8
MSLWLVLIRELNLLIGYFFLKDTEFPGIVVRPLGEFKTTAEYQYQCLKLNVDFLKIIQLGFTFMDSQGKSPPGVCSYQFNFNFNLTYEKFSLKVFLASDKFACIILGWICMHKIL